MTTLTQSRIGPALEQVIAKVCERHATTPEEILSGSRKERVAYARQMVGWLLRLRGWGYKDIAEIFENHHGTVMHSCQAVNNRFDVDKWWPTIWPEYAEFRVATQCYEPIGEEVDRW
jgi:chromosomal replication initiation ATPase DnaA